MPKYLDGVSANGVTTGISWAGGQGTAFAEGVFDGARFTVRARKYGTGPFVTQHSKYIFDEPRHDGYASAACDLEITVENVGPNTDLHFGIEPLTT